MINYFKRMKNEYMVTLEREKETNAKITQEVVRYLTPNQLPIGQMSLFEFLNES